MDQAIIDQIMIDPAASRGYARGPALQTQFEDAAKRLLESDHWKTEDGDTPAGPPELRCDLALEGGGVKGIALVGAVLVLDEAGYKIQRVAGTSAGAIAASLIAAIVQRGRPMIDLKRYLDTMEFAKFMPEGKIHDFLDRIGHRAGELTADFSILLTRMGLYPGTYLYDWLGPILKDLDTETFGQLRINQADDPGMSLPLERQYRLLVHTSDVTRRVLARLPWDCNRYGKKPDDMGVADAVRASMSIPFFFEPFKLDGVRGDGERAHARRPHGGAALCRRHGHVGRRRNASKFSHHSLRPYRRQATSLADHWHQAQQFRCLFRTDDRLRPHVWTGD